MHAHLREHFQPQNTAGNFDRVVEGSLEGTREVQALGVVVAAVNRVLNRTLVNVLAPARIRVRCLVTREARARSLCVVSNSAGVLASAIVECAGVGGCKNDNVKFLSILTLDSTCEPAKMEVSYSSNC